jgi:uncharacterized membrane protein YgaE (UPF0421/DUF939 family)
MVPARHHRHPRVLLARAGERLRARGRPILQTAAAAVAAYYLSLLALDDPSPSFASIAAVIAIGASYGQHRQRALQLVGGVVVGISVADLIVHAIGAGPSQIGLMVVLAMTTAVILGGSELVISEAAVSAILLVALAPGSDPSAFSPNRILEAVIGGGVALAVAATFPSDPSLRVGRAAQAVFGALGDTLECVAAALARGDVGAAERALSDARETDRLVATLDETLRDGRETARLAPPRRSLREPLERYARSLGQIDYAVRDTRVLARHVSRRVRSGDPRLQALAPAVHELARAVWELAGAYERPERTAAARAHAIAAASVADELDGHAGADEVLAQIRSVAVDLRRAADLTAGAGAGGEPVHERPTEELLLPA